jgi:hypothetical protein
MANLPNGILGAFVGKAGNITGYIRNGKNFIRTRNNRKNIKPTAARLAQREKIKVCGEFTSAFSGTGFFKKSFPAYGNSGTGYNRATSALMNLAVTGNYPNVSLAYPLVLISKGPLPVAENATATVNADGNILFTWANNSGTGTAKTNDKAIVVAYFPELKQIIYSLNAGTRADGKAILPAANMPGYAAETWIGFLSNDETDAANSVYTARIIL